MSNRTIEDFHTEIVLPTLKKCISELDYDYRQNKAIYQEKLEKQIKDFLSSCSKKSTRYLHLSWLRSPYFIAKRGIYTLEAYSENWYEDSNKRERMIAFNWVFEYIGRFFGELENQRSLYHFLPSYVCEQMVSRYFHFFQAYIKAIFPTYVIPASIVAWVGEYHGDSEPVTLAGIRKNGSLERIKKRPEFFMYHRVPDIFAQGQTHHQSVFTKMNFQNAELLSCDFQKSLLIGATFVDSKLSQTDFSHSYLQDSRFENCDCRGCDFRYIDGEIASSDVKIPSYFSVSFQHSDLSDADFRFAKLKGADFTDTRLVGARFMETQQSELNLTTEQIEQIEWIKT